MSAGRRRLVCACCGGEAGRWKQWFNQDTGFGVCSACVEWQKARGETVERIKELYGFEGANWGPA